jgi:hypothetical protein
VAADLLRDDAAFERAIAGMASAPARLSPLAEALMAELLDRRVGADAKKAWVGALGGISTNDGDPLVSDVAKRH